jgi:hypothetical protein
MSRKVWNFTGQELRLGSASATPIPADGYCQIVPMYPQGQGAVLELGDGTAQALSDPMAAIVTRARHGLVVVELGGQPYALRDITLRMLTPRELATAQGFGPEYQLVGTIAQQIAQVGNSVCPPVAEALVRANP